jgi:hypothetical protein
VRTDRNRISPRFCPLLAYVDFAACSSLYTAIAIEQEKPTSAQRFVAMWPRLTAAGVDPYTAATEAQFDALLKPVFARAFAARAPKLPTPHSLRVVGLIWHLRCQVPQERTKLCGRWLGLNLKSWSKYARGGEQAAEQYRRQKKMDPMYCFWCAHDSFIGYIE